jgi:type IX secretion system PorP/SprF family membrane protein
MRTFVIYLFIFIFISLASYKSQQFPQYTQFIFNKIGYNPAASGTAVNAQFEIIFGGRAQWIGLSNNPKSQFVSFNYNFMPKRSYHSWHNVGAYIDQDQNGAFTHIDLWLSYTYHLLVSRKMVFSAGIFAGVKQYRFSANSFDQGDPAIQKSASAIIGYPDIVPGVRLSNKKFFIDASLQQISMFKLSGIGGQIGSPSKLIPHYIFSVGKKGRLNDYHTIMLAANLKGSVITLPSIEINVMDYYNKRFALGASLRSRNFVCGIVQFRLVQNLNIGLAYELSINKMFRPAANTVEVMVSISPVFGGELTDKSSKRSVNDCTF